MDDGRDHDMVGKKSEVAVMRIGQQHPLSRCTG